VASNEHTDPSRWCPAGRDVRPGARQRGPLAERLRAQARMPAPRWSNALPTRCTRGLATSRPDRLAASPLAPRSGSASEDRCPAGSSGSRSGCHDSTAASSLPADCGAGFQPASVCRQGCLHHNPSSSPGRGPNGRQLPPPMSCRPVPFTQPQPISPRRAGVARLESPRWSWSSLRKADSAGRTRPDPTGAHVCGTSPTP